MKRTKSLLSLLPCVLLLAVACDQGEPDDPEALEDRVAVAAPAEAPASDDRTHRTGRGHGGAKKLIRLCEKLECTDEQLVRIAALTERLKPERDERLKGDVVAANQALAEAFRGDAFAVADLEAWRAAAKPVGEEGALAPVVVELHGILEADQRDVLAQKIERHGLPFAGGKGKHHRGRKHGRDDEAGAERAAHKAARLCVPLSCAPEQEQQIAAVLQARPERPEVPEAARLALAEAFRGASLSEAAVRAYLDAAAETRAQHQATKHAQIVAVHALLTPEQRATLADRVQQDGPRALGLGKGKSGKHGKGHGRGGKRRGPRGEADGTQQLG